MLTLLDIGDSFTRMNRELKFGWTSLPNLGVFRDSSREPVSPVGTYRSASHPDENLRWSMPRSAVSTDVFGCVAALCMGTIWGYDTP